MEYWNDDLKKMTIFYLIPSNRNFTITQLSIFPEPNIPLLQHSTIPIGVKPLTSYIYKGSAVTGHGSSVFLVYSDNCFLNHSTTRLETCWR
jgi:hypothetical protein